MVFAITVLLNSLKSTCKAIFLLCIALVTSIPRHRVQSGTPGGFLDPEKSADCLTCANPPLALPDGSGLFQQDGALSEHDKELKVLPQPFSLIELLWDVLRKRKVIQSMVASHDNIQDLLQSL